MSSYDYCSVVPNEHAHHVVKSFSDSIIGHILVEKRERNVTDLGCLKALSSSWVVAARALGLTPKGVQAEMNIMKELVFDPEADEV